MKGKLKGIILSNFLYLILFYIIYFTLVPAGKYMVDQIKQTEPLSEYASNIPSSTSAFMDFLLYVVIPIAALIWTIISSRQPEYQVVQ